MESLNNYRHVRFSHLSPPRRALVRMLQAVNFGEIRAVSVRNADPLFEPAPVVAIDAKLYRDDKPRPELALADFELPDEMRRLMTRLDDVKNGTILRIEVRAGLPRRMIFESRLGGSLP